MNITDLTIDQLRAATKAQIITAIDNKLAAMTKRQIILFLLDNVDRISDSPVITRRQDGQVESQVDIERDAETGNQVLKREVLHTYYPSGEVDTITVKTYDGSNALTSTRTIKHYTNGRQPQTTIT